MTTPKQWPTVPAGNDEAPLRAFLSQAAERLHPDSGAPAAERAFLSGQLVGLCSRLIDRLEWP